MNRKNDLYKSTFGFSGLSIRIGDIKLNIFTILLIVIVGWFVWSGIKQTLLNNKLRAENNRIKGVVIDKYKVGGKGTIQIDYLFKLNQNTYSGSTTNEKYNVGDSLYILFLKEDPRINRSYSFINE